MIDYLGAYDEGTRADVTAVTGMGALPQVAGVVPGSPADLAGARAGDAIVAVNGARVETLLAATPDKALFGDALVERIGATPAGSPVELVVERGGQRLDLQIEPVRMCSARFVVSDGGIDAHTDGKNVAVTGRMLDFTRNDDELALVSGHELAHVIERDGKATGLADRRHKEDRADILGADLARCAGYDVTTGLGFWKHFHDRDWLRWFRDPTHRNVPDRMRRMAAHVAATPMRCPPAVPD